MSGGGLVKVAGTDERDGARRILDVISVAGCT